MVDDIWLPPPLATLDPPQTAVIRSGLYNANFRDPPPDQAANIDNETNPLPGWKVVASAASMTAKYLAPFSILATAIGGVAADSLYLEQVILTPGYVGVDALWACTYAIDYLAGTAFLRTRYLDATGAVSGAGGDSATSYPVLANGTGIIPDNAAGLRVRVGVELTGGYTGSTIGILSVTANRFPTVVSSSVWSGTSFPASPATDDRFYRTDRDIQYYYDGTRWLSTTLYSDTFVLHGGFPLPLTVTSAGYAYLPAPWPDVYDAWVIDFQTSVYVSGGTALGASHKWVIICQKQDSTTTTTIATFNLDSGSINTERTNITAVGALLGSTAGYLNTTATKTGTPGSLYITHRMRYRLLG